MLNHYVDKNQGGMITVKQLFRPEPQQALYKKLLSYVNKSMSSTSGRSVPRVQSDSRSCCAQNAERTDFVRKTIEESSEQRGFVETVRQRSVVDCCSKTMPTYDHSATYRTG